MTDRKQAINRILEGRTDVESINNDNAENKHKELHIKPTTDMYRKTILVNEGTMSADEKKIKQVRKIVNDLKKSNSKDIFSDLNKMAELAREIKQSDYKKEADEYIEWARKIIHKAMNNGDTPTPEDIAKTDKANKEWEEEREEQTVERIKKTYKSLGRAKDPLYVYATLKQMIKDLKNEDNKKEVAQIAKKMEEWKKEYDRRNK